MSKTSIQWTHREGTVGETWNPIAGCSLVSKGCELCYAMKMAARLEAMGQAKYAGTTRKGARGPIWTGKVNLIPEALEIPLRRKRPTTWFVNSMSDLFHPDVSFDFIDRVFAVMKITPWHTYQILTKRPERAREWFDCTEPQFTHLRLAFAAQNWPHDLVKAIRHVYRDDRAAIDAGDFVGLFPLPNVWLGVSVEDQKRADERIPHLLRTPAAVRFLSCEPLLESVDLRRWVHPRCPKCNRGPHPDYYHDPDFCDGVGAQYLPPIDWVIVGGESGPNARPFDIQWARSIVAQCKAAAVPVFVKQLGSRPIEGGGHYSLAGPGVCMVGQLERPIKLADRKGGNWFEWPADLRVREFPTVQSAVAGRLF